MIIKFFALSEHLEHLRTKETARKKMRKPEFHCIWIEIDDVTVLSFFTQIMTFKLQNSVGSSVLRPEANYVVLTVCSQ